MQWYKPQEGWKALAELHQKGARLVSTSLALATLASK